MRDPYKVNIIQENLGKMAGDEYYLVRLKGDAGKSINLDEGALKLLKAYYEDTVPALTPEQRDAVYRNVWHGHVCDDIHTWMNDHAEDLGFTALSEKQVQYAARHYVDGCYDCEQSYWENIKGAVKLALEQCPA